MQPKYLDIMLLACTCLHNYLVNDEIFENIIETVPINSILQNLQADSVSRENAMCIRDKFKTYFNSCGAVSWQNEMISRN